MLKGSFFQSFFRVLVLSGFLFHKISFSQIYNHGGGHQGHSHEGHSHSDGSEPEANGEGSSRAEDFWKGTKNVSASNRCPSYLVEKVKEDSKIGIRNWFGKKSGSSDDYCSNALSKLTDTPDAAELSKRLASHPMTSFGDKGESISENCLGSVQDPERKKLLVAEYHSNTARLKVASISTLESMATIDSLLGKNSLQDVDCSQSGMPRMEANCKKLKSCQARGGLEQQAKEIQDIYPQYLALKKEVSNINSSNALSAMSMGPGYISNPAQMSAMKERSDKSSENQKKILALEAMYPALTGKVFKSTFDPSKQNFQEALRSQLEKSREKISEQFNDYQKGIRCMSGRSGSCDDFDKTMKSAPPLNIQAFKRGEGLSVEDSYVQAYLGAVECRQKIREVHENQNEALKDLAVGTALTVGTMGLGSIAATAKLASTSAETAAQAAQFASRAKMASNALVGVDLISLGKGGKEAYEHCSKSLNQLSGAQPKNDSSKTQASCPSESGSSAIPQLSADYRSCVAQVLLQGVTNGLPLVPGALAGAKSALGSAEKGALSAEKSLAREGAILEKETSSEVKGLASSHRDAETRLAEMTPEKRARINENMALSDGDRSAKIAKEFNLAVDDPRVKDLMNLHADARYSKTLEGSTEELQGKITEAMDILHPGYKDLDGPARNALASERVKVKGLVTNGVLGQANTSNLSGNRNAMSLLEVSSKNGDQSSVKKATKPYVEEFLRGQKDHLGLSNSTDAAEYLFHQQNREIAHNQALESKGLSRGSYLESSIRKQKALLDEYPELGSLVGKEEVKKVNDSFAKLKTVETSSVPNASSASSPKPISTPATVAAASLPPSTPKPKPPANATKESVTLLANMDKSTDLGSKLTNARMATEASANNGSSVEVAQFALNQLKENPELLKNSKVVKYLLFIEHFKQF